MSSITKRVFSHCWLIHSLRSRIRGTCNPAKKSLPRNLPKGGGDPRGVLSTIMGFWVANICRGAELERNFKDPAPSAPSRNIRSSRRSSDGPTMYCHLQASQVRTTGYGSKIKPDHLPGFHVGCLCSTPLWLWLKKPEPTWVALVSGNMERSPSCLILSHNHMTIFWGPMFSEFPFCWGWCFRK